MENNTVQGCSVGPHCHNTSTLWAESKSA